jgi:hypothetical protein
MDHVKRRRTAFDVELAASVPRIFITGATGRVGGSLQR